MCEFCFTFYIFGFSRVRKKIQLPTRGLERLAEVRIVPKCDCYVIEVIYEKTEQFLAPNEKIAAIDLDIDNLMAVTSNQEG